MSHEAGFERSHYDEEPAMRRQPALEYSLDGLEKSMANLREHIVMLINRLDLVTQPTEPRPEVMPGGGAPTETRPVSPATGRVDDIAAQLNRMTDRINDVMNRLDT